MPNALPERLLQIIGPPSYEDACYALMAELGVSADDVMGALWDLESRGLAEQDRRGRFWRTGEIPKDRNIGGCGG